MPTLASSRSRVFMPMPAIAATLAKSLESPSGVLPPAKGAKGGKTAPVQPKNRAVVGGSVRDGPA